VGLCAIAIDGSLQAFVRRLAYGNYLDEVLQGGHQLSDVFRFDHPQINGKQVSVFACFVFAASLSTGLVLLTKQNIWPRSLISASVVLIVVVLAATGKFFPNPSTEVVQANQLLAITIGIGLAWFTSPGWRTRMKRDIAALLVLFALLPYAYAI